MSHADYKPTELQKLLKDSGFKTSYFAKLLGKSDNNFRWFARKPQNITQEQAEILAEVLNKPVAYIVKICREQVQNG